MGEQENFTGTETEDSTESFKLEYIRQHSDYGYRKIARGLSISLGTAKTLMRKVRGSDRIVGSSKVNKFKGVISMAVPDTFRRGINAEEFKQQVDVVKVTSDGLRKLSEEGKVELDGDFRAELGVPVGIWPQIRNLEKFQANQLTVRGKLYWGDAETLNEIRRKMDVL